MNQNKFEEFVAEINHRAHEAQGLEISNFQDIRVRIRNFERRPHNRIFSAQTIGNLWAFHHGGRSELQYNVGFEHESQEFRFGVAFSLEPSRTLPTIDALVPKIRLFNEYLARHLSELEGFSMWHFVGPDSERSPNRYPSLIADELVKPGNFIFLGNLLPTDQIDVATIIEKFEELLPLYKFVESDGEEVPAPTSVPQFNFTPRESRGSYTATASQGHRSVSIELRHNKLRDALVDELRCEYGAENVGSEIGSGNGGRIDVVVRREEDYLFYEIKVGASLRDCIREALGQLLEYGFWPGANNPTELVIVGEKRLNEEGREYLDVLGRQFSIPVNYRQISIEE